MNLINIRYWRKNGNQNIHVIDNYGMSSWRSNITKYPCQPVHTIKSPLLLLTQSVIQSSSQTQFWQPWSGDFNLFHRAEYPVSWISNFQNPIHYAWSWIPISSTKFNFVPLMGIMYTIEQKFYYSIWKHLHLDCWLRASLGLKRGYLRYNYKIKITPQIP